MLKPLTICLTVATLLLSMLLPVQAGTSSGCANTTVTEDICHAPGTAAPARAAAEKPCLTCVLPADTTLPASTHVQLTLGPSPGAPEKPGRAISPDKRPPRA